MATMFGCWSWAVISASDRNRARAWGFSELTAEKHLEGNDPVEAFLSGLVNHAHAAVADLGQEFVVGEVTQDER